MCISASPTAIWAPSHPRIQSKIDRLSAQLQRGAKITMRGQAQDDEGDIRQSLGSLSVGNCHGLLC